MPSVVDATGLERANGWRYSAELVGNTFVGLPIGSVLFAAAVWLPFGVDAVSFVLASPAVAQSIAGPGKTGPVPNPVLLDITGLFQEKFASVGDDMFIGGQPTEKALRDLGLLAIERIHGVVLPLPVVSAAEARVALAQDLVRQPAGHRHRVRDELELTLDLDVVERAGIAHVDRSIEADQIGRAHV